MSKLNSKPIKKKSKGKTTNKPIESLREPYNAPEGDVSETLKKEGFIESPIIVPESDKTITVSTKHKVDSSQAPKPKEQERINTLPHHIQTKLNTLPHQIQLFTLIYTTCFNYAESARQAGCGGKKPQIQAQQWLKKHPIVKDIITDICEHKEQNLININMKGINKLMDVGERRYELQSNLLPALRKVLEGPITQDSLPSIVKGIELDAKLGGELVNKTDVRSVQVRYKTNYDQES